MIEGHGDDIYRYNDLVKTNFSSNVFQHAELTLLKDYLDSHFHLIANYPEPQPRSLEKLIAEKENISPESVMVTNGATEAIYMIARLFHGSISIIPQPTFNEYADACRLNKHIITYDNNNDVLQMTRDRVYWICNPNNPSGKVLKKDYMDYVVRRWPRYTFVVDQSYEDYTLEPLLEAHEMQDVSNVFLLHSMSKTYGVPGLRLGYITSAPANIQLLRTLRQPWSVGTLSIEAGSFLLQHGTPVISNLTAYLAETQRLRGMLCEVGGVRVFETKTNYMLCELEHLSAAELKERLIREYGILIRDCSNFQGLSNHFFRVSAQTPSENDALVAAIRDILKQDK